MLFRKKYLLRIALFKISRQTKNLRFLEAKLNQNLIFCVQRFFENLLFENVSILQNHAVKILFLQYPTRRKIFHFKI